VSAFARGEIGKGVFAMGGRPAGGRNRGALTDRVLTPERLTGVSGFTPAEAFRHLPVALIEELA